LDISGCASRDVAGAMQEMSDIASLSNCKNYIFHMSFRAPDGVTMTDIQKLYAVETYEKILGLQGHQKVVVVHENEGHDHVHVAWNRVNPETGNALNMSFSKLKLHAASRILEHDLGHEYVQSGEYSHDAVCGILKDHNRADVVQWIERQHEPERIIAASYTHGEEHQARSKKIDIETVARDCQESWQISDTGKGLAAALDERGYVLAAGNKRDWVVVDAIGGVHSLPRRVGCLAKDVQERCCDLHREMLPDVEQAKALQSERNKSDESRPPLVHDEREDARIKALERGQQLRADKVEKAIHETFERKEKQILEDIKKPTPEPQIGALGTVYEKVAKKVNKKFKTREERIREKEEKFKAVVAEKKKLVERAKEKRLSEYRQHEVKYRESEKQRLEKELEYQKKQENAISLSYQRAAQEKQKDIDKSRDR
jgi:hypothetical protein